MQKLKLPQAQKVSDYSHVRIRRGVWGSAAESRVEIVPASRWG